MRREKEAVKYGGVSSPIHKQLFHRSLGLRPKEILWMKMEWEVLPWVDGVLYGS